MLEELKQKLKEKSEELKSVKAENKDQLEAINKLLQEHEENINKVLVLRFIVAVILLVKNSSFNDTQTPRAEKMSLECIHCFIEKSFFLSSWKRNMNRNVRMKLKHYRKQWKRKKVK